LIPGGYSDVGSTPDRGDQCLCVSEVRIQKEWV
jgi:hypothetical protein